MRVTTFTGNDWHAGAVTPMFRERIDFKLSPGGRLLGSARLPGDKSISHRAIMLAAVAEGVSEITGFLEGEDCLATLAAFRRMGVPIDGPTRGKVRVTGVGLRGLSAPEEPLDLGNSGTSMRLLSGLLAGQEFASVLNGDSSLSRRPMRRVTDPLRLMGAEIRSTDEGTPPLHIRGRALRGIRYQLPVASAQVKSCLLLAGLYASERTCVRELAPTRDHTERMLRGFGCEVQLVDGWICVAGAPRLQATSIDVPADISSAAFFLVGASIAPGSELILEHVGMNETRHGVIRILRLMGADITLLSSKWVGGEPVADLRVRSAPLRGISIPPELVPLAIDEFPALFVAAACAEGDTILEGAEELRVKESDRLQAMADGLQVLGVIADPRHDGIAIRGGRIGGGEVDTRGDHRIAMSFAMAALRATDAITLRDCANVETSFPDFVGVAAGLGLGVSAMRRESV
jgi:3-phosphoshikimate 1-carboxyvinyltransferase